MQRVRTYCAACAPQGVEALLLGVLKGACDRCGVQQSLTLQLTAYRVQLPDKPVCPVCSSSLLYGLSPNGYECGHCHERLDAPVEGCVLSETGEHDETWMNDGVCACGADGGKPAS